MLSDEEKKAIEGLEWSQQQMRLGNLPDYDQGHYADIRIILNLIEKQSKEIEELNKSDESKEQSSMKYYNLYRELVDKIKAKKEELKKECKNCEFGKFLCKQCFTEKGISILESLEEE